MSQKPKYCCGECGKPVEVEGPLVIRVCSHDGAAIQVSLSATVTGKARVAG